MANIKNKFSNVYDYILSEENKFKTERIPIANNWQWSMYEHIDKSFQLKNSQFTKGNNDFTRPFKNIILPIANVNYRTEGFDVKDIEIFVNNKDNYHKSLLARKFHSKWAKKYSIDTAIDESVESYFDYGLTLVKNVNQQRPEVVPLQMIAFCDQSNILSGPICLKHNYSVSDLDEMRGKWDDKKIDSVIAYSEFEFENKDDNKVKTPGKYIEVYELHGIFPTTWLGEDYEDNGEYSRQLHIVTFYTDLESGEKSGICLYKGVENEPIFKALVRDPIFGRACGRGGIEELFHPQIWSNYSEIHLQQMLEATSKVVLQTASKKIAKNNKLSNFKQGQIIDNDGNPLTQVAIQPFNKAAFDGYINTWEQNARTIGSASDPQLGLNPTSGTPLGTTQIVTSQGEGIHQYRRGKIAIFWGEIYRDWVLKYLADEMNKGDEWIDELSLDELQEVADKVANKLTNQRIKEALLSGKIVTKEAQDELKNVIKQEFMKGGSKRFLEIMKGEIKGLPLDVDFNIAGKQKNLYDIVNKLNGIFRTVFANPSILSQPGMSDLFNNILEYSGLSPVDFSGLSQPATPPPQMNQPPEQPTTPQPSALVPTLQTS